MRSLRGEAWLTMLTLLAALTVGVFGLPSTPISTPSVSATSIPSHSRGSVKAKQTTPAYLPDGKPTISGTSSKSASASSEVTVVIDATTVDSGGSSPSSKRTAGNAVTAAPFVASTTPTVTSTATSTPASTAPPTFLPASASPATVAVVTSAVSSDPTSRTIVPPIQEGSGFVSSSRKSVSTGSVEATTPTAPNFAKETRESPGKIGPQIKLTTNYTSVGETGVRLPEGASAALAKPTKYHYYPHNQHIYLLPECAVQQVCNAVYVRLNYTQPLCACPGRYRDPCSASLDSDDLHTTELVTDPRTKALTLVKTCEPVAEMRECRTPRDWSLLALQNVRTGKSHYLVICRCPDANILEGPMSHDQPTYASVPGIRVYGMMCVQGTRRGRPLRYARSAGTETETETETEADDAESRIGRERSPGKEDSETKSPRFPWDQIQRLLDAAAWD